jgi:hypothetical protein
MGFANKSTTSAAKNGGAKKSRWGGIPSAQPKEPIIEASPNPQRVRFLSSEITFNEGSGHESHKTLAAIVSSDVHKPGDVVLIGPFIINGKSKRVGEGRVKAMAVAGMGLETDEQFDALYPDGEPIDLALNGDEGESSYIGNEALVIVSRGGAREGGDYFREYEWAPTE